MELTICAMSGGHEEIDGRCPLDILVVDNQDTVVGIRNVMHSFLNQRLGLGNVGLNCQFFSIIIFIGGILEVNFF